MRLYRSFFEGKGWSPERLNELTPKQLLGIAGGDERPRRSFSSLAEAMADHQKTQGGAGGV